VLGAHIYVKGPLGYDPEGLLGTLPAIAQALIGVAAGEWLAARRGAKGLAIAGVALLVVGIAWGVVYPVSRTCGPAATSWSPAAWRCWCWPPASGAGREGVAPTGRGFLTDFGINAIFAYVLHELASIILTAHMLKIPYDACRRWWGQDGGLDPGGDLHRAGVGGGSLHAAQGLGGEGLGPRSSRLSAAWADPPPPPPASCMKNRRAGAMRLTAAMPTPRARRSSGLSLENRRTKPSKASALVTLSNRRQRA
jgi:hypothetical protein